MLTTEDMTNVELFTELRDELSKAKGNMIYENDIPDQFLQFKEDGDYFVFDGKPKISDKRFKPNGITDRRQEYRAKRNLRLNNPELFKEIAPKRTTDRD